MNYIDLTNNTSGTTNYERLSNQPQINNVTLSGNKSLSDLGINQPLPNGYEITVDASGNGDFTDIQSAINSLTGKYSAGTVTINVSNETYTILDTLIIDGRLFNIANLIIQGNNTTLTSTISIMEIQYLSNNFKIDGFTCSSTLSENDNWGITINWSTTNITISNLTFNNFKYDIISRNSTIMIKDNLSCSNALNAFLISHKSNLYIDSTATITLNNIITAFQVIRLSQISSKDATYTFNNVTNKTNITPMEYSPSGAIYIEGTF